MHSIGIGSKTSTGGAVIEGNGGILFDGLVASSVGHQASCPACKKGIGPIVAVGPRTANLPAGPAARAGDYVACGCPPGSNVLVAPGTISIGSGSGSSPIAAFSDSLTSRGAPSIGSRDSNSAEGDSLGTPLSVSDAEANSAANVSDNPLSTDKKTYRYELDKQEFQIRQAAYLPVEGVGVNGTFFIRGSLSLSGRALFISAMGFTAAKQMGTVLFHASVSLLVNGHKTSSTPMKLDSETSSIWPADEYSAIGSVTLTLPEPDPNVSVRIEITGGYVYSAPEGGAVPIPPTGDHMISLAILEVR